VYKMKSNVKNRKKPVLSDQSNKIKKVTKENWSLNWKTFLIPLLFVLFGLYIVTNDPFIRNINEKNENVNQNIKTNQDGEKYTDNKERDVENMETKDSSFTPTIINKIKMKDVSIDNKDYSFKELRHNNINSSVKVYQIDDFLTKDECDGLSRVHLKHVEQANKLNALFCFSSVNSFRKYLKEAGLQFKVSSSDFTAGTSCLNETFSNKIKDFLNWSYSTAFYQGESKFSMTFEERLQNISSLMPSHGGKFQITSYPKSIGYKSHTDCEIDRTDPRDRYATALVYLQNVKNGGETKFTKLGISVKPKQGRLIIWNNMKSNGICDETSIHQAIPVINGRKYILQRWYYYQNFKFLGKRPPEPDVPQRKKFQPRISCDYYEEGSCRWYDEWGYDHLNEYNNVKNNLV